MRRLKLPRPVTPAMDSGSFTNATHCWHFNGRRREEYEAFQTNREGDVSMVPQHNHGQGTRLI